MKPEWVPLGIRYTELVACTEVTKILLETCKYTPPPDIKRYQFEVIVNLFDAKTGKKVATLSKKGTKPRECQASESVEITTLNGSEISSNELIPLLEQYVDTRSAK